MRGATRLAFVTSTQCFQIVYRLQSNFQIAVNHQRQFNSLKFSKYILKICVTCRTFLNVSLLSLNNIVKHKFILLSKVGNILSIYMKSTSYYFYKSRKYLHFFYFQVNQCGLEIRRFFRTEISEISSVGSSLELYVAPLLNRKIIFVSSLLLVKSKIRPQALPI